MFLIDHSGNCLPVIEVCLWLVLEAVVAAPAVAAFVVVVEALDEAWTPGGAGGADGKDDVTGVAVVGVGGEPDSREPGGGPISMREGIR